VGVGVGKVQLVCFYIDAKNSSREIDPVLKQTMTVCIIISLSRSSILPSTNGSFVKQVFWIQ